MDNISFHVFNISSYLKKCLPFQCGCDTSSKTPWKKSHLYFANTIYTVPVPLQSLLYVLSHATYLDFYNSLARMYCSLWRNVFVSIHETFDASSFVILKESFSHMYVCHYLHPLIFVLFTIVTGDTSSDTPLRWDFPIKLKSIIHIHLLLSQTSNHSLIMHPSLYPHIVERHV